MTPSQAKQSRKFTLIELLIVIAIIGILVTLLMPQLGKAREMTKRVVCASNQKQLYTGLVLYSKNNRNKYPQRMPARIWPFGHYIAREDGAGFTYDSIGTDGEILQLKTSGFSALVESELITAYEVFYCPSGNDWIQKSKYKPRIHPGASEKWFPHYSYWKSYKPALAVDDKIVTSVYSDSDTVFISDMMLSTGANHTRSNHNTLTGITEGGNITFNDGTVKWRNYSSMKYRYTYLVDFWW